MTNLRISAMLILPALAAACGGEALRYPVAAPEAQERVRSGFASIEVRDISLPTYADGDEIWVETADGALVSSSDVLWADAPARAVSLELSRHLARITGARVANEPWPFDALPEARLEVRIETLLASTAGTFRIAGQYFVAGDGERDRTGLFSFEVPIAPEGGPAAIAAARGRAVLELAQLIAAEGLR